MRSSSFRSLAAISASLYLAGSSSAAKVECPTTSLLSCTADAESATLNPKSCCTNTADNGLYKYTQTWERDHKKWKLGNFGIFSCDGKTQKKLCNRDRAYSTNDLLDRMRGYNGGFGDEFYSLSATIQSMGWPGQQEGETLMQIWSQMWTEHAACISTLATDCTGSEGLGIAEFIASFPKTHVQLRTAEFLDAANITAIEPGVETTYTRAEIVDALEKGSNVRADLVCNGTSLEQVVYTYAVEGRFQDAKIRLPTGDLVSDESCPEEGVVFRAPVEQEYSEREVAEALEKMQLIREAHERRVQEAEEARIAAEEEAQRALEAEAEAAAAAEGEEEVLQVEDEPVESVYTREEL